MNLKEINRVLLDTFHKELSDGKKRHIVFWYDEEGEFVEEIDELDLDGVRVWKLSLNNLFATKYELEKVDPNSHFLIYANMAKPHPREDWLLDVYKYSQEFATDKVTVTMRNLGITNEALRPVFKRYKKFFNNKEREATFEALKNQTFTEETIDIGVLCVLCKCSFLSLDEVVKTLFREQVQETNKYWENIQKFGDEDTFWILIERIYGFNEEEKSIENLFMFFMLTNLSETLTVPIPQTWVKHVSRSSTNCIVLMNQFMNYGGDQEIYNELADKVENQIKVKKYIEEWELKDYIKSDTFRLFDEKMIQYIIGQLKNDIQQYAYYTEVINKRRKLHWYKMFQYEYEALTHAIVLFNKVFEWDYLIPQQNPYDMFKTYTEKYYTIDQAYRKFYVAFDKIEEKDWFTGIREKVENVYANWYVNELSIKWSDTIEHELGENWPISGLEQQQQFYHSVIKPYENKGERVFVIISDALRFEAARELCDLLNKERKASTEIIAMQGVLPSYTDLGMASLLPYKEITLVEKEQKNADVYIDGHKASSTENRNAVLSSYTEDAVVVQYKQLIDMNRQKFRDALSGKKVVYIYHNTIDARGDHAATEREVFEAVEDTFKELRLLVNQLINNVSASNIIITADHGFIYKRDVLQASDKVARSHEQGDIEKRRFMISSHQPSIEGTMSFSMDYILGKESAKYVTVPRGANRFAIQGTGANYVHGGATLQEIVVPIIKFKNDRSKSSKNDVKKVDVKLTSISRKITNSIIYLEFFQIEKVEDKKNPLRLKLYIVDEEGIRISNENIIIADSKSSKPEDRSYREKFVLKSMTYDKAKRYYLVLEDEEETVENIYEKVPFTIDIAITNDFGF